MKSLKFLFFAAAIAASPVAAQTGAAQSGGTQSAHTSGHQALVTKAFNNFETIMFAPLRIDQRTPVAGVKAVCHSVQESLDRLVANAEARAALELPDTLEEAQALNQYLAGRFRKLQERMQRSAQQIQTSGQIIEGHCPELSVQQNLAQTAMQIALAQYTPEGWCRAMLEKPRENWSSQDQDYFGRFCQGVISN